MKIGGRGRIGENEVANLLRECPRLLAKMLNTTADNI